MPNLRDRIGDVVGRLTVLARAPNKGRCVTWFCQCSCGTLKIVSAANLLASKTASCGCYAKERQSEVGKSRFVHGHGREGAKTPTYRSYMSMIQRTTDPGSAHFAAYGAKGIGVCARWRSGEDGKRGFECFLADMGERPPGTSIDRIDVYRGYEPDNCRWADRVTQARNKTTTKLTQQQVVEIRQLGLTGQSNAAIGRQYGVCGSYVGDLIAMRKRAA